MGNSDNFINDNGCREMSNDNVKTSHNNHLLMYLLQNRAEDFIREFEAQNNRCFMGVLSLYRIAFANKILLNDTEWSLNFLPIVECGRKENQNILDYLGNVISIPSDFLDDFKKFIKPFAWFDEEYDFDFMLDASLDELEKMGYRDIDCKLYEAGLKFNFNELERLLNLGADPYIKISAENSPNDAQKKDIIIDDVYSLYDDLDRHYCDCTSIYGVGDCWKDGICGKETIVDSRIVRELFLGAGCKLGCDIIRNQH